MAQPLTAAHFKPRPRVAITSMPSATALATHMADALNNTLSQFAAVNWRVSLERVEESRPSQAGPFSAPLRLESAAGSLTLLIILDRAAISAVIEAVMGGSGAEAPFDIGERPVSGIEAATLDAVMSRIGDGIGKALTVQFERPFSCFRENARPSPSSLLEEYVSFRFILNVFGYSGEIVARMPRNELLHQMAAGSNQTDDAGNMIIRQQMQHEVRKSEVELKVTLSPEKLFVEDIADLRVGKMIPLSSTASGSVTLWSGGVAAFEGTLARARDRLAVSIIAALS